MLADISPKTAGVIALIMQPTLALSIFLMLVRIILSWYPNVKLNKFPYSVAVAPTEPFLGPTRRAVPPIGGVDVAPVSCPGLQGACVMVVLHQMHMILGYVLLPAALGCLLCLMRSINDGSE